MPGNCRIELDGVDADGAHKFLAVSAWFDVLKNLGQGSNLPPKDEITAALESMQVYVSGAAASAEDAKRWAEQSAAASAEIEQQLQDAVDVTQALTDKTTEAQGVVDELGDMLAEADLSQYVTKTGTSVVTGDLRIPAPATADSAVNRKYADGKLDKTGGTMEGLIVSKYGSNENNPAFSIQTNGNPGSWNTPPIEFKNGSTLGDTFWLRFAKASNTDGLIIPSKLKEGLPDVNSRFRYTHGDTPVEGTDLTPKDYSDAVPYQYAKKAGWNYPEALLKKYVSNTPVVIQKVYNNTTSRGYQRLAISKEAIGTTNVGGNLIIRGCCRHYEDAMFFTICINNRVSSATCVNFEGFGNEKINIGKNGNILVVINADNKYEVYFEKTSADNKWLLLNIEMIQDYEAWTIDAPTNITLTSGTIPGTKIWDLKTAWGTTSRTQITKEEVEGGIQFNGTTVMGLQSSGNSANSCFFEFKTKREGTEKNIRLQGWSAATTDDLPRLHISVVGSDNVEREVQIVGISDPKNASEIVNLRTLNNRLATLEAKLTGKTVAEVLAANSIPAAAPSLEKSSEEEEEITV